MLIERKELEKALEVIQANNYRHQLDNMAACLEEILDGIYREKRDYADIIECAS